MSPSKNARAHFGYPHQHKVFHEFLNAEIVNTVICRIRLELRLITFKINALETKNRTALVILSQFFRFSYWCKCCAGHLAVPHQLGQQVGKD